MAYPPFPSFGWDAVRTPTIWCVGIFYRSPTSRGWEVDIGLTEEQAEALDPSYSEVSKRLPLVELAAWGFWDGGYVRKHKIATLGDVRFRPPLIPMTKDIPMHQGAKFILRVEAAKVRYGGGNLCVDLVMWPSKLRRNKGDIDETQIVDPV